MNDQIQSGDDAQKKSKMGTGVGIGLILGAGFGTTFGEIISSLESN